MASSWADWYEVTNKSIGMGGAAVIIWVTWNAWNVYRQRAIRQKAKLKTVTARLGYFLRAVCSLVALLLVAYGGLFAYGDRNGLPIACVVWGSAFLIWLLGRGVFFVLAGSVTNDEHQPV